MKRLALNEIEILRPLIQVWHINSVFQIYLWLSVRLIVWLPDVRRDGGQRPLSCASGAFRLQTGLLRCNYLLMRRLRRRLDVHVSSVIYIYLLGYLLVYCPKSVYLGLYLFQLINVDEQSLLLGQ